MSIQTLHIPFQGTYIKQGDTIPKIVFTFSDSDNIDLTLPNVEVKMQLFNGYQRIIDISIGNGITVVSSKVFEIDEVSKEDNNFPVATLVGDLEITDTDGKRFTYFNVSYSVIKEYTK